MIEAPELTPTPASPNVFVNALLGGTGYVPGTVITYVLRGTDGDSGDHGGTVWAHVGRRAAFEAALQAWSAVANITFAESAGAYSAANTTYDWVESFSSEDPSLLGSHSLPAVGTLTGRYNMSSGIYESTSAIGSMAFSTFVHEIGHGLGLLHPHNEAGDPQTDPAFPGVTDPFSLGLYNQNQGVFTVMSYNGGYSEVGLSPTNNYGWEAGPMAYDIAAIQAIYGANMATNAGATAYLLPQVNAIGTGWRCIWDGGGTDTISAAGTAFDVIIDLRPANLESFPGAGGYVSRITGILGGFTIAAGAVIENAVGGSGDDRLHGNAAANILDGGSGWDTADYTGTGEALTINLKTGAVTGSGGDTLLSIEAAIGGSGDDTLIARDGLMLNAATMDQYLLRNGGAYDQTDPFRITGFTAHTGDPTVTTGVGLVSATVKVAQPDFGTGSRYFEVVVPTAGTTLTIDIDNSYLADLSVVLRNTVGTEVARNDDGQVLDPGSANVLDPFLTYTTTVANQRFLIEVRCPLQSSTLVDPSYDLNVTMTGAQVTNMALIGSRLDGGDGNDVLLGGTGIDTLFGGNGDNYFDGGGNADILVGGFGADTYIVRDSLVTIVEAGSYPDPHDTVIAYLSYSLPTNVETLRIAAGFEANGWGNSSDNWLYGNELGNALNGGIGADFLYGNGGADTLYGGDQADTLDGGEGFDLLYGEDGNDWLYGSSGGPADELIGGLGDDRYIVVRPDDLIVESADQGWDMVVATCSLYLTANVERLQIEGIGDFYGVGNELDNFVIGNEGANLLIAGGGNDWISGLDGNDAAFGETGDDIIHGGYGIDYLVGGSGSDTIYGQRGPDAIYGEDGDDILLADTLTTTAFNPIFTSVSEQPDFVTDILVGGNGNDTLYGNSGLADYDLMDGGDGDDSYWVDTGDDLTFEAVGGGTDTVHADVLVPNAGVYLYANVENLILEGTTAFGVGNELNNQLTGSASGNWLLGGAGADTINGKAGNDVLFGEAGADTFVFEAGSGADVIGDFTHGSDRIRLIGSWTSFAQVQAGFHQNGGDGAIDLGGGNLIVLQGVTLGTLTAADFLFG
ncbi:MAG: M10 family metallopeptidase C-terminal domain-containing protein [Novosphingobium sp.]